MSHSIEQTANFHLVRRIAKVIAPDFRIFATPQIDQDECILDLKRKTIEVGENTIELRAVAAILFQLGQLKIKKLDKFSEHFGKIIDVPEHRLIRTLAKQGEEVDQLACKWAVTLLMAHWGLEESKALSIVSPYIWTESEWITYYK